MHRFYVENIIQGINPLPESEAKHAMQVLRLQENDNVMLLDGKGNKAQATLCNCRKKACDAQVMEIVFTPAPKRLLTIAVAPPKSNDRWNFVLEKCQELGVSEIVPLKTFHSERININPERNNFALIAALKQSGGNYLCKLSEMQNLSAFLKDYSFDNKYVAYVPENGKDSAKILQSTPDKTCIIIGPEGDFSIEEIEQATAEGCKTISLGEDV